MADDPLVTWVHDEGQHTTAVYYLLPDGRRKKVWIQSAYDSEDMRAKIGDAFLAGRVGIGKGGR